MLDYGHGAGECSVTGGVVVRDRRLAALYGRYLYGDFCVGRVRSLKIVGGTMLLTPGMKEDDFDVLAAEGCRVVKFIFFPYDRSLEEGALYSDWAKARDAPRLGCLSGDPRRLRSRRSPPASPSTSTVSD